MAERKPSRKGHQIVFWLNEQLEDHREVVAIVNEYRRRRKNLSDLVRRGILLAYWLETRQFDKVWQALPAEAQKALTKEVTIEKIVEVRPVIVEVNYPQGLPAVPPVREERREQRKAIEIEGDFEVEDAPSSEVGKNIDDSFSDFF